MLPVTQAVEDQPVEKPTSDAYAIRSHALHCPTCIPGMLLSPRATETSTAVKYCR